MYWFPLAYTIIGILSLYGIWRYHWWKHFLVIRRYGFNKQQFGKSWFRSFILFSPWCGTRTYLHVSTLYIHMYIHVLICCMCSVMSDHEDVMNEKNLIAWGHYRRREQKLLLLTNDHHYSLLITIIFKYYNPIYNPMCIDFYNQPLLITMRW